MQLKDPSMGMNLQYSNCRFILSWGSYEICIDIRDVTSERHTAENLHKIVNEMLKELNIPWSSIVSVITDAPSVMTKLHRLITNTPDSKHVVSFRCILHMLCNLCKDLVKAEEFATVFKKACKLVNFFTASHKWFQVIRTYAASIGITKSFASYVPTRFYSVIYVLAGALEHKAAFQHMLSVYSSHPKEHSKIKKKIVETIEDPLFWANLEV